MLRPDRQTKGGPKCYCLSGPTPFFSFGPAVYALVRVVVRLALLFIFIVVGVLVSDDRAPRAPKVFMFDA